MLSDITDTSLSVRTLAVAHHSSTKLLGAGLWPKTDDALAKVTVVPDSEEENEEPDTPGHRRVPLDEVVSVSLEEMLEVEGLVTLQSDNEEETQTIFSVPQEDPFYVPKAHISKSMPVVTTVINVGESSDSEQESASLKLLAPARTKAVRRVIESDSEPEEVDVLEDDGSLKMDGSVLTLDDGVGFRKPFMRVSVTNVFKTPSRTGLATIPNSESAKRAEALSHTDPFISTPKGSVVKEKGKGKGKGRPKGVSLLSTQSTPGTPSTPGTKQKRMSKKALEEAAKQHREKYALEFFHLLNGEIFGGGLPEGTQLLWNTRLQTTAGKAHWERTKEGKETSIIQLSPKILDCDERIRNTLSHELCHLACWIINRKLKENHGKLWKGWAHRVMQKFPDVDITTRHSYEIAYKFTWKCNKCDKIYGRHSKSINPQACYCGVCKEGDLIPQFVERTPKIKANSCMVSDATRDSPSSIGPSSRRYIPLADTPSRLRSVEDDETDTEEIELMSFSSRPAVSNDDGCMAGIVQQLSVIDLTEDD